MITKEIKAYKEVSIFSKSNFDKVDKLNDVVVAEYAQDSGDICFYCALAFPVIFIMALIFIPQG